MGSPNQAESRKQKFTLNLIKLYKQNECLWNTKDKDFLNLPLKNNIWEDIAMTLGRAGKVDYIKRYMHTLRYRVNLQKVQELEAKVYQDLIAPTKLYYTDELNFLNHTTLHQELEKKKVPDEAKLSQQHKDKKSHSFVKNLKSKLKPIDSPASERLGIYKKLRNCTDRNCLKYEAYKRLNHLVFALKLQKLKLKEVLLQQQQELERQQQQDLSYSSDSTDDYDEIDGNLCVCGTSSWETFVLSVPRSKTKL